MNQGSLFDAGEKPKTKPAKAPVWVVDELVNKWGIRRETAAKYPSGQAFAILYRCRERKNPGLTIAARKKEVAAALVAFLKDEFADRQTAIDLVAEGVGLLDGGPLAAIVRTAIDALAA